MIDTHVTLHVRIVNHPNYQGLEEAQRKRWSWANSTVGHPDNFIYVYVNYWKLRYHRGKFFQVSHDGVTHWRPTRNAEWEDVPEHLK